VEVLPARFIGVPIQAEFDEPPLLQKKPGCPDAFVWDGVRYRILEKTAEWHDYRRRGRMARNMSPAHATVASGRGSWGVGRDYFRVKTDSGRVFDIYYDRAPQDAANRAGGWFLFRELERG
jgi:hypothetical protein